MVKFNLITGFLGSGKTTLLSNILQDISAHTKVAVIQNEFAPTGVDGKELQQNADGFKLIEINNGSVFCVCQLNNFEQTLEKLLDTYQPEIIFLEASGLSDPISIAELLQVSSLKNRVSLDKVICLVDALNYQKGLGTLVRFKHQIMIADLILLNKIDLFEGSLEKLTDSIKSINPFANLLETSYAKVSWQEHINGLNKGENVSERFVGETSGGRPDMNTCVLRLHDKITKEALTAFVTSLQASCIRIKGFVNLKDGSTVLMQSVFDKLEIKQVNAYAGPTEIIVFGNDLQVGNLRKLFKSYCK